ncbi:ATP-binding protein [Frisingicoccus sp.]|uniref:sensor histidine kinase n=1 Tax=Frisingicoccus sp. TaxID=1918627 RepID=UPI003AB2763C
MKYKMTYRLIGYFSAVLLLFAVAVGGMLMFLLSKQMTEAYEEELKARAVSISETLSAFSRGEGQMPGMESSQGHGHGKGAGSGTAGGYGGYLRFIDDIAMSEVWLVDEKARTIETTHMESALSVGELPENAEAVVEKVFQGQVEISREFSPVVGVPSVTVGAPVTDGGGNIVAAVLLHSPVAGIENSRKEGMKILWFCIIAALALGGILSVLLARRFIRPLKKMDAAAGKLMEGDYGICTGIRQNDEIGALAGNLDALSGRLRELNDERENEEQLRRDFMSSISHELRTPVTVIKGSLEVLNEGMAADEAERAEYLRQMLADANYLQGLVNDLLELSRLQNIGFHIEKSPLNLMDVLEESVRSMRPVAGARQIKMTLENFVGPVSFMGDYGRLRQMFTVILDNAVKFSPEKESVEIRVFGERDEKVISIRDFGSGISPEDIPHIFERFYRGRREENHSGTGLGLAIAKEIAKRHQINIYCESTLGQGTVFYFKFKGEDE